MKGQTFTPDFMASIIVFGVILTIFLSSWNSVIDSQTSSVSQSSARLQASNTVSFLVSTPGYPDNWEQSSVEVEIPGFASPDQVLQEAKLQEFRELGYESQKSLLQAGNYYMTVENETGIIEMNGEPLEFGQDYSGANTVIPITRNVQLNTSSKMQDATLKYVVFGQ